MPSDTVNCPATGTVPFQFAKPGLVFANDPYVEKASGTLLTSAVDLL